MGELKFCPSSCPAKRGATGQTYVEVIAAVGLVAMALLVLVSLKTAQLKLSGQTANKAIAFNLMIEGQEITESLRLDHRERGEPKLHSIGAGNWVLDYNTTWNDSYTTTTAIATNNASLSDCSNCYLCQQADDSFLKCSDPNALFKRMVSVDVSSTSTQITSKVIYFEKTWKSINLERFLTEWDQNEI